MKKIFILICLCIMILCVATNKKSFAKVLSEHKVYPERTCENRIKVIKNYYNKNKMTVVKRKWSWNMSKGTINFYFHGSDLMFGYGTGTKGTQYRLYFYKNQLIRLLVDKKGKRRKTYKQIYRKNPTMDNYMNMSMYLELENFGRREAALKGRATAKILTGSLVKITKVTGNTIYYHKLYCTGPDGYVQWIGKRLYKAKLSKNAVITEYDSPDEPNKHSKDWLKKIVNSGQGSGYCVSLKRTGKTVSKADGVYFA